MPDYKYDVFVSYAHRDDEPLLEGAKGWVRTLVDKLKARADAEVRGKKVEIWMDPRLAGNRPFEEAILEGLDQAATLIIFMSVQYADSYWCQREQSTFLEKVKNLPNSQDRIFVVEKNKLDDDQKLPNEFLGLPRYLFWHEDNISKRVKIFGEPAPREDEEAYWVELARLAHDLAQELNQLRKQPEGVAAHAAPAIPDGATLAPPKGPDRPPVPSGGDSCVFLAEVTDDLRRKYNEVKIYLEQCGIRVLPKVPYDRYDRSAYQQAMAADLKACKLFVQILSGFAGENSDEFPGYPVYQYQIARSQNLPVFQWRAKELNVEEADSQAQKDLLNLPSVRAEPIDDFKKDVREAALVNTPPPPPPPPGKLVFVNTDTCDWSLADKISQWLSERGVMTFMPIPRDTPNLTGEQITQDFEQSLSECDGLIVIYGNSLVPWVRNQFRLGGKILAKRSQPLVAVYEAPPPEKPDHGVRYPGMLPLNCRGNTEQPDEAALKLFVEKLRG